MGRTRKTDCYFVAPGPVIEKRELKEENQIVSDDDWRKAWMTRPVSYSMFKRRLIGGGLFELRRVQIYNRDKDEWLHLESGPEPQEVAVPGKQVRTERWAGPHRIDAAKRYEIEETAARVEWARPDQKPGTQWMFVGVVFALIAGVAIEGFLILLGRLTA